MDYTWTNEIELLIGENRREEEMLERYKKKRRTDLRHDWYVRERPGVTIG